MSEEEYVPNDDTAAPATAAKADKAKASAPEPSTEAGEDAAPEQTEGPALHKVRTTNRPDVEVEVDDRELADLRAFGFLADDEKKGR